MKILARVIGYAACVAVAAYIVSALATPPVGQSTGTNPNMIGPYNEPDAQKSATATYANTAGTSNYAANAGSATSCSGTAAACGGGGGMIYTDPGLSNYSAIVDQNGDITPQTGGNWITTVGGRSLPRVPEWSELFTVQLNYPVTYCVSSIVDSNGQTVASNNIPTGQVEKNGSVSTTGTMTIVFGVASEAGAEQNHWPYQVDPTAKMLINCHGSAWGATNPYVPPKPPPYCKPGMICPIP